MKTKMILGKSVSGKVLRSVRDSIINSADNLLTILLDERTYESVYKSMRASMGRSIWVSIMTNSIIRIWKRR